jgi:hypothetical protein
MLIANLIATVSLCSRMLCMVKHQSVLQVFLFTQSTMDLDIIANETPSTQ